MKKVLIAVSVIFLLLILYLLYELKLAKNEKLLTPITGDVATISQLVNELNIKAEELSGLQSENQLLKNALSGAMESLNSLQVENTELEESLSGCEIRVEKYIEYIKKVREVNNSNVGNNTTNNTSNNNSSTSNTTVINGKEYGLITQVYTDRNGNRKIEIDYVQLLNGINCGAPETSTCIVNDDSTLRTFTVSDNVKIFTHSIDGYVKDGEVSFDYFEQKSKDINTHYYDGYSYNYSNYFKNIPFRITIENNIVVKIEEEYMP